jgi:hypothetical protein
MAARRRLVRTSASDSDGVVLRGASVLAAYRDEAAGNNDRANVLMRIPGGAQAKVEPPTTYLRTEEAVSQRMRARLQRRRQFA